MKKKYEHLKIEKKWQKYWLEKKIFMAKDFDQRQKKFVLTEFPYPSGDGLHMGHLRGYTAGDVYSRFLRLQGYNVLFPMGWDAFGLPAENYAIKTGIQPKIITAKNIKNIKKQIIEAGYSFDWSREVNTTDPEYYKWTQYLFLQFFKKGLAFEATGEINWCPSCKTGLANEEVIDNKCERCGQQTEKKELRQWYLRITAYAEKLLKGLEELKQWPESVRELQKNWIGKSEGAEIEFKIKNSELGIKVFTTRVDTLFGCTYVVVAPEHELISKIKNQKSKFQFEITNKEEIQKYIAQTKKKSEIERTNAEKEKTGVRLEGVMAINPANDEEVPIFVADYVLGDYGTGAVMAVPAHDERDFEFAQKFNLAIKKVIEYPEGFPEDKPYIGEGVVINSIAWMDGLLSVDAREEIVGKLEFKKLANKKITYKLRDWGFSRQRYWGEPIPIIHCNKCGVVPVPEKDLPVLLPAVKKYQPTGTGESPLAAVASWVNTKCPKCKGPGKRETNTMPQWAGSSWYYLRYADAKNKKTFADKKKTKYWQPVDMYFGGMEHTTLHLLYSRFWNLFLYDQKLITNREPYLVRQPHGIVLAADGEKMSKSRGNVVNPVDYFKNYGADTTRMFMLFLGPHEMSTVWKDDGIIGVRRFLERVWSWVLDKKEEIKNQKDSRIIEKELHQLIKKITEDIESRHFNTAVSAFMQFHNKIKDEKINLEQIKTFLILLSPLAPHITEELYQILGGKKSLQLEKWPKFDPKLLKEDEIVLMIQINGKTRGQIKIKGNEAEEKIKNLILENKEIAKWLEGKEIKKFIYVKGRLVSLVV